MTANLDHAAVRSSQQARTRIREMILPFVLISSFLFWKFILYLDFPIPGNGDGPWFLSQTYSWMRGDFFQASFGFAHIDPYLNPYMYAVITVPFFSLNLPPEYSLQIYILIWQILSLILVYRILHHAGYTSGLSVSFVFISIISTPFFYLLRNEAPCITLALLLVWILRKSAQVDLKHLISISLLSTVIGLIHPVGGVFAVAITTAFFSIQGYKLSNYGKYLALVGCFILLLYGPVVFRNFPAWWNSFYNPTVRAEHSPKIITALKYFSQNPFLFAPYLMVLFANRRTWKTILKELLLISIFVAILALFGKSYYFPYLIVFIVWRLSDYAPPTITKSFLFLVVMTFPILSHFLPTIQQIENREYVYLARQNLVAVQSYAPVAETHKLWVPPYFGMMVIDQPESRAHHSCSLQQKITLQPGDVILYDQPAAKECLISRFLTNPPETLKITTIHEEVKGLVTISSLFRSRSNPIGLWEIRLKDE